MKKYMGICSLIGLLGAISVASASPSDQPLCDIVTGSQGLFCKVFGFKKGSDVDFEQYSDGELSDCYFNPGTLGEYPGNSQIVLAQMKSALGANECRVESNKCDIEY